jgi:hypothetical protein
MWPRVRVKRDEGMTSSIPSRRDGGISTPKMTPFFRRAIPQTLPAGQARADAAPQQVRRATASPPARFRAVAAREDRL